MCGRHGQILDVKQEATATAQFLQTLYSGTCQVLSQLMGLCAMLPGWRLYSRTSYSLGGVAKRHTHHSNFRTSRATVGFSPDARLRMPLQFGHYSRRPRTSIVVELGLSARRLWAALPFSGHFSCLRRAPRVPHPEINRRCRMHRFRLRCASWCTVYSPSPTRNTSSTAMEAAALL